MRVVVALVLLSAVLAAPAGPSAPAHAAPAQPQDGGPSTPAVTRIPPVTVSPNPYVEMADKFIEEMLLQSEHGPPPQGQGDTQDDTPPRVAPVTQSPEELFDRLMDEVFSKTTAAATGDAPPGGAATTTAATTTEAARPVTAATAAPSVPATAATPQTENSPSKTACACPASVHNPDSAPCECMRFSECAGPQPAESDKLAFPGPISGDTCPGFYTVCCVRLQPRSRASPAAAEAPARGVVAEAAAEAPARGVVAEAAPEAPASAVPTGAVPAPAAAGGSR